MRFALVILLIMAALPARAVGLLRDPDIEHALGELAKPVLQAAGLGSVRILVVDDRSLNAFVLDHKHIFIHSGLILKMDRPEMLQAVIAHEAAHIANGHISRRLSNLQTARTAAGIGMALAIAAGAASNNSEAAAGLALGASSSARRVFLSHTRAEEAAADQSSARYMASAGIDITGAVALQEIFRGQEALAGHRQDPYNRSHPLNRDRLRVMKGLVAAYNTSPKPRPQDRYWYERARGKLAGFIRSPKATLRAAKTSQYEDLRLMQTAIAYHRRSDVKRALAAINGAIKLRPKDPYYHELKGQILLEARQFPAAVAAYGRARSLAPRHALILGGHGRALLANNQPAQARDALEKSRGRDFLNGRVLRDLAAAYARTGNAAMASLVSAERYALQGRMKDAAIHAKRARGLLPNGSSGQRRADDILVAAKRAQK